MRNPASRTTGPPADDIRAVSPGLARFTSETIAADLSKRPGLSPRPQHYAGWPNVFSAMPVAKDVLAKRPG